MGSMGMTSVDLYMDPLCAWSHVVVQWIGEVQRQREVQVRWHPMSLSLLSDPSASPDESWGPLRVMASATEVDPDKVGALVAALGRRVHLDERRDLDAVAREAAAEAGLPASVADAAGSAEWDERVRESHGTAVALSGPGVGSPVIELPGADGAPVGFYGPIIAEAPRGADAARVWDAVLVLAGTPGFFELKRDRDEEIRFE